MLLAGSRTAPAKVAECPQCPDVASEPSCLEDEDSTSAGGRDVRAMQVAERPAPPVAKSEEDKTDSAPVSSPDKSDPKPAIAATGAPKVALTTRTEATKHPWQADVPAPHKPIDTRVAETPPPAVGNSDTPIEERDVYDTELEDAAGEVIEWEADRDGVHAALRSAMPEMKKCYEAWAAMQPGLAGQITLGVRIQREAPESEAGKVAAVNVLNSDLEHAFMEGCVAGAVEGLRFTGLPSDTLEVRIPFRFRQE